MTLENVAKIVIVVCIIVTITAVAIVMYNRTTETPHVPRPSSSEENFFCLEKELRQEYERGIQDGKREMLKELFPEASR